MTQGRLAMELGTPGYDLLQIISTWFALAHAWQRAEGKKVLSNSTSSIAGLASIVG